MKKYIFLTIAIVTSTFLSAQNSDKAKALLDDVYTKVSGYENIFVDFRFELKNTEADINSETRGTVTLQGDQYLGDLFGTKQLKIWCGRRDSNSHAVKHWNLNPACLPIPPLPRVGWATGLEPATTGITIRGSTN